jgi:hypothetical protein
MNSDELWFFPQFFSSEVPVLVLVPKPSPGLVPVPEPISVPDLVPVPEPDPNSDPVPVWFYRVELEPMILTRQTK